MVSDDARKQDIAVLALHHHIMEGIAKSVYVYNARELRNYINRALVTPGGPLQRVVCAELSQMRHPWMSQVPTKAMFRYRREVDEAIAAATAAEAYEEIMQEGAEDSGYESLDVSIHSTPSLSRTSTTKSTDSHNDEGDRDDDDGGDIERPGIRKEC
jgi:DNA-binding NtrC family response regulator